MNKNDKNKNHNKRDLTWASETLSNENASAKQRSIAAQDLANHRWEQQYKQALARARSSSASRRTGR